MSDAGSNKADYALYEKSARQYDRVRFSGVAGNWGHRRQVEILKGMCDDWRGKNVLEIGCGTGRITEALTSWGAKVTATDVSEAMLEVAKERFNGERRFTAIPDFRVMSVFNIDMDIRNYDYVLMVNVFGHLSKPREAIHEISSKMSKTCKFVFTFPCLTSVLLPFGLLVNARGKSIARNVTSHWYMPGTIEKYCNDAGLVVVRQLGHHYVPVTRILFMTLPLFWACDRIIAKSFPRRCPSVFVECKPLLTTHKRENR